MSDLLRICFSSSLLLLLVLGCGWAPLAQARSLEAGLSAEDLRAEDLTLAVDTPGTGVNNITLKISEVAVFSSTSMRVYGFRNDTTGVLIGAMSPQVYWWIDGPTTIACSSGLPSGSFGGTLTTPERTALMDEDEHLVLTWPATLGELDAEPFTLHFRICTSDPDTRGLSTTPVQVYTNHVTTTAYRKPVADSSSAQAADLRISRAFADGLGRAILAVDIGASPDSTDLVSVTAYDSLGHVSRQHLSFVADTTGNLAFQLDALDQQQAFWQHPPDPDVVPNPTPFAEVRHEASPLRRPLEAGAAAPAWQLDATEAHTVRTHYYTNDADDLYVRWAEDSLVVRGGGLPDSLATVLRTGDAFAPATLYRTVTIDPNGDSTAVVTDGEGREVMKEAYLGGGQPVRTYYIYDHFGQLRFVVPPIATEALGDTLTGSGGDWSATHTTASKRADAAFRTKYFTEYRYDAYGRQIEKKLPEEEVVTTVYDRLGRVVLQQDGVFRPDSLWYFTKYDPYGRVVLTGTWTDLAGRDRAQMQAHVDTTITGTKDAGAGTYAYYEIRQASTEHGYTEAEAFPPLSESTVWTVSYFDDYDFAFNGGSPQFVGSDFPSTGSDAGQHYVSGFAMTDRVLDQATGGKVLLPDVPGIFEQAHYGAGFVPVEPDTVYLLPAQSGGTITLGPGFSTNNGQHVEVGPVTPAGTATAARYLETVTYYDAWGRAIQSQSTNHLGGVDRTSTQYSHDGLALAANTVHQTLHDTVTVSSRSEYDHAGRLLRTYQQHQSEPEVMVAQLHYNALGEVMQKDLHSDDGGTSFTKSVQYEYHVRGWLTRAYIPGMWDFRLYYDTLPEDNPNNLYSYWSGGEARFDGSVTAQAWDNEAYMATNYGYLYQYDGLGRLQEAQHGQARNRDDFGSWIWDWNAESAYSVESLRYDRNGNIERLRRRDGSGVIVDDLSYNYDASAPNRLLSVADASSDTTAMYFRAASSCSFGSEYAYDGNGSMVVDPHKCIAIEYNYKNLPVSVEWEDGRRIEWTYDATGAKLRKRVLDAVGSVVSQLDYVGGFVYRSGGGTSPRLAFYGQPEGRVVVDETGGALFEYVISDHLGNSRVVFEEGGGVVQEDHYYPFGLKLAGLVNSSTSEPHQFTYNGKELEDDHDLWWYHYGVRYYDPQVARWHAIDPADEFHTPYAYVGNDPVNFIDPDGAQADHWDNDCGCFAPGAITVTEERWQWDVENAGGRWSVWFYEFTNRPLYHITDGYLGGPVGDINRYEYIYNKTTGEYLRVYHGPGFVTGVPPLPARAGVARGAGAAAGLPRLRGKPHSSIRKILSQSGFNRTKISKSPARNEDWQHADGSVVKIHPYGNKNTVIYRTGNNAHIHKYDSMGRTLDDRGLVSGDPNATHIGIPNPPDLPFIRNRQHGAGSQ